MSHPQFSLRLKPRIKHQAQKIAAKNGESLSAMITRLLESEIERHTEADHV